MRVEDPVEGMVSPCDTSMEARFTSSTEYVAEARVLPLEAERCSNVPVARSLSTATDAKQDVRRWHTERQPLLEYERAQHQSFGSCSSRLTHLVQEAPAPDVDPCMIPSHLRVQEHKGFSSSVPR